MNNYVFLPYSEKFPTLFRNEEKRIRKVVGKEPVIEHVGSTAVPGLGGKGVIDICVAVPKKEMKHVSAKFDSELGYSYQPDAGVDGMRLFHHIDLVGEDNIKRHYHVHITFPESSDYKEMIAFRDYLKNNPKEARKYADVKRKAVKLVGGLSSKKRLKEEYMFMKQGLIKEIIRKALQDKP